MKKKNSILFYPLIIMEALLMLLSSCKKDNNNSTSNPTNGKTTAVFNPSKTYGTVTDIDGNVYKTITIGTQTWMAENLRTTKYRNGKAIPEVIDTTAWINLSTGAYCNYKNTRNTDTIATFGRLYNWYAVADTRNIAPTGWHVPIDAEWTTLTTYLGGESVAGDKLKELGTTHWVTDLNTGVDNSSGFTALPGGSRDSDGTFSDIGHDGHLWSSSESNIDNAWTRLMQYYVRGVFRDDYSKVVGFSVRCVRD